MKIIILLIQGKRVKSLDLTRVDEFPSPLFLWYTFNVRRFNLKETLPHYFISSVALNAFPK